MNERRILSVLSQPAALRCGIEVHSVKAVSQKQRESISASSVARSVGRGKQASMSQPPLAVYWEIALRQKGRRRKVLRGQIVAFKEQHKIREALITEERQRERLHDERKER